MPSPEAYISEPYTVGKHEWRLIIKGNPLRGYYTLWQWRRRNDLRWQDAITFQPNYPKSLWTIVETSERSALADYRMKETIGNFPYPQWHANPLAQPTKKQTARRRAR